MKKIEYLLKGLLQFELVWIISAWIVVFKMTADNRIPLEFKLLFVTIFFGFAGLIGRNYLNQIQLFVDNNKSPRKKII